MNQMEEALYRAGAHIAFKEVDLTDKRAPLSKWKEIRFPGFVERVATSKQRIIGRIPLDPVDRQAAIVTSKKPKY